MDKDESKDDQELEKQVLNALDESLEDLSNHARHRLYLARQQALQQADRKIRFPNSIWTKVIRNSLLWKSPPSSGFNWYSLWKPLLPVAVTVAFVGVFFLIQPGQTPVPELEAGWETDSELLFGEDDLELYEDLEFYAWLAEVETG